MEFETLVLDENQCWSHIMSHFYDAIFQFVQFCCSLNLFTLLIYLFIQYKFHY